MASRDFTLSRGKTLAFALIVVFGFFGVLELGARLSGLDAAPAPRILLRRMDVDITFPFMQADRELFWAPVPGFRGRFLERPVAINSLGVRGPEPARELERGWTLSGGSCRPEAPARRAVRATLTGRSTGGSGTGRTEPPQPTRGRRTCVGR